MPTDEEKERKEGKEEEEREEERSVEDMFLESFPGDEDKVIERGPKHVIYWVPPLVVAGFSWLFGIRHPFHLIVITLIVSAVISGLLYYLFFAESDYFSGFFRDLFRRRGPY